MAKELSKRQLIEKIKQAQRIKDELDSRHYLEDLYDFNKHVMNYPDISETPHRKLCKFVTNNPLKKKLILLPRDHLKSSMVTVGYSCQQVAKNPNIRILIVNATYNMAVSFLRQIKGTLKNGKEFRRFYGDLTAGAKRWREDAITVTRTGAFEKGEPTVTAYGMGGNLVSRHYDMIILDDIVNRDTIATKEQIDKTIIYYKDILDLLEPEGQLIIIGTRWHYADLYSWIMENFKDDFDILIGRAYYGEWGSGKLLFPNKFDWDRLAELKRQKGNYSFSCQYMNEPTDPKDAVFKRENFKYYDDDVIRGRVLNHFTTIDPAISLAKGADYSVILTVAVDLWNNWYVREIVRGKYTPEQLIEQVFLADEKWHPKRIAIETYAFQKVLQYTINDEMRRRNHFLPLEQLKHETDRSKEDRIRALQPRYQQGAIHHCQSLPNNDWLEDELTRFPKGKHDDIIDALAYMLQIAFPSKKKEGQQRRKKYLY